MKNAKRRFLTQILAALLGLLLGGLIAFEVTPKVHVDILSKEVGSQRGRSTESPSFRSLPTHRSPQNQQQYALDHILVQFKLGIDASTAAKIVGQLGSTLEVAIQQGQLTIYKVKTTPRKTVEDLVKNLSGNANVEIAEFDYIDHLD